MSTKFEHGMPLTAELLNELATEEALTQVAKNAKDDLTDAKTALRNELAQKLNPELDGTIRLKHTASENAFLLTATSEGLEIRHDGADKPAMTILNDGTLIYPRKTLRIELKYHPIKNDNFMAGSPMSLKEGYYNVIGGFGLGNSSHTGNYFIHAANGTYTLYDTTGKEQGTSSSFVPGSCSIYYYKDSSPLNSVIEFNGSDDITYELPVYIG